MGGGVVLSPDRTESPRSQESEGKTYHGGTETRRTAKDVRSGHWVIGKTRRSGKPGCSYHNFCCSAKSG